MSDMDNEAVGPESDKIADTETDLQVEIVDDTPPEDKNRPRRAGEPDLQRKTRYPSTAIRSRSA